MVSYQLPLKPFSYAYEDLTDPENDLVNYFQSINLCSISKVVDECYRGSGPKGYGSSLFLSRILKVKERFFSDRDLACKLAQNELYRCLCLIKRGYTPSHNTYNTLRKSLGIKGYAEIHTNFVRDAQELGLLDPNLDELPKNRREGVILIADSTFIRAYGSTKGQRQEDDSWLFSDPSLSFGRPHHKYKYPVGHKAHSLITITGIPIVSFVGANNIHDQHYIIPLLDEAKRRFPDLRVAYIVLDKGYDNEVIYKTIFESYGIIPVIIRKKMVYPKGFTSEGIPLCPMGHPMKRRGIDYKHRRTKYLCERVCQESPQLQLDICEHLKSDSPYGSLCYTYFKDGYRKYGPALPSSIIYKRLKPYRTAIERNYGLVKENRYRLEYTNTYKGFDNVLMHVIEHDIVLTQDIIFNFKKSGKISSVIKV